MLHSVKFGVWCAVTARKFVGPMFFKETVNCERYAQVILGQFFPELTEEERLCDWFQQDSATAHTARMSVQALSDVFGDKIISSGIWPACSSNLNPCDILFWSCLKDKVYYSNPRTEWIDKTKIRTEIANIPAEHLQRVNQNLFRRCEECLRVEGQHFPQLLLSVNCNYFIPNVIGQRIDSSAKFICASQPVVHRWA
jgi:hypothetical protein